MRHTSRSAPPNSMFSTTTNELLTVLPTARTAGEKSVLPLHDAAETGSVSLVALLLEGGAGLEDRDDDGSTPLHVAAECGHRDVAAFLLTLGANIEARNSQRWTPLHIAARNGYLAVVSLLVKCGANLNATDSEGWTPLHATTGNQNSSASVAALLVHAGADTTAPDSDGWTPLHVAAANGYTDAAGVLLDTATFADVVTTRCGWIPLGIATNCHDGSVGNDVADVTMLLLQHSSGHAQNVPV